ncbi:ATP-dependent DNA ligase [Caldisericum exile]|uniref:ATP-dependent DNA ligase family profile domain-containing protein n=1 Tax=Caldisericum exile (strain DSM 21853 / NBRC 104410 / AZM16c01) TaxID=511051 RepID=A0A7U6GFZ0_CALEA|nr:hypothetical protein [Caldisericum exile]BAL81670.1 hypothetical protein CSE_15440 [Caldisericum exile AZM16c01]
MEDTDFIESDVRLFYEILSHENESEIRLINVGVYPIVKIVKGVEKFVSVAREYNDKSNVYTVLRERRPNFKGSARAEDIIKVQIIALDFDPIREKEYPSNDDELKRAVDVATKIAEDFEKKGFLMPHIAATGNGAALYFKIEAIPITSDSRTYITELLQRFEEYVRSEYKALLHKNEVRLDNMYDLPRIGRVIGTKNIKGTETKDRPHRVSRFLYVNTPLRNDKNLFDFIKSLSKKPYVILEEMVSYEPLKLSKKPPSSQQSLHSEQKMASTTEQTLIFEGSPVYPMQPIPYFGEVLVGNWIWEYKVDGFRLQIIKNDGKIYYFGRRLEKNPDWTEKLNKVIPFESFRNLPDKSMLDAELYSTIGRRGVPSVFANNGKAAPIIYVFDVIFYAGTFVGNLPLSKRKEMLNSIEFLPPIFVLPYFKVENLENHLKEAISKGFEGIVIKELNSKYEVGFDAPIATQWWRKIKPK